MKSKEEMNYKIVVEYSDKHIDKDILAELFYDILIQNQGKGVNYDTEEDNCA